MSYLSSDYDIQYDIPALSSEQIDTIASSSLLGGPVPVSSTYTINTGNTTFGPQGPYYTPGIWSTSGTQPTLYTTSGSNGTSGGSLRVVGDAEFEGKVKINGQDLAEFMETMSKRLAILVPDPKKLEHFKALQKAYDHYKLMEALCQLPDNVDDK